MTAHETFTITRTLSARPETVFRAWADPALKRRWFVDSDGPQWSERRYELDFRVGGRETGSFELADGPGKGTHENVTHYLEITPNARIVYAYTMAMNGRIHSASLASVGLEPSGDGTRLTYTEQGAFFEGSDGANMRRGGWEHLLTALETFVEKETA